MMGASSALFISSKSAVTSAMTARFSLSVRSFPGVAMRALSNSSTPSPASSTDVHESLAHTPLICSSAAGST